MNPHHHLNLKPVTLDSKVKGFTLYVESDDTCLAITALENALSKLKCGDAAFKERSTMVGSVRVGYDYPYRPHCAMIGPYWDE